MVNRNLCFSTHFPLHRRLFYSKGKITPPNPVQWTFTFLGRPYKTSHRGNSLATGLESSQNAVLLYARTRLHPTPEIVHYPARAQERIMMLLVVEIISKSRLHYHYCVMCACSGWSRCWQGGPGLVPDVLRPPASGRARLATRRSMPPSLHGLHGYQIALPARLGWPLAGH